MPAGTCPYCNERISLAAERGEEVRCPSCGHPLRVVVNPPPAPETPLAVAPESRLTSLLKRKSQPWLMSWWLIAGLWVVVLVLLGGIWLWSQKGGSGMLSEVLSDPYKTAVRQYLSDHNPGKVVELEWGPRRQFVGVRVSGEWENRGGLVENSIVGHVYYYELSSQSPAHKIDDLGHNLTNAFFSHPANKTEQELFQESWKPMYLWYQGGRGELRNVTWRASDPFTALTLKYKIETPALGQTAAMAVQFCFEPGSRKIFATQNVTPAEL